MENHPNQSLLELVLINVLYQRFKHSGSGLQARDARDRVQYEIQLVSNDLINQWEISGYDYYYYLRQAKRALQDQYQLICSPKHGYWVITQKGIDLFENKNRAV